ncbi:hypothetical protein FNV43_RR24439 [Rhamnella rubrinervis]|uniref:Uncharacterized protein n=1 Tax=Rhamnella rubrinervis TaxID=2594499 RepID=A0A8K0DLH6_9ROSA|nr:hypothetical protein FNV43_RR24439 [Rhamnella rubrinervis]
MAIGKEWARRRRSWLDTRPLSPRRTTLRLLSFFFLVASSSPWISSSLTCPCHWDKKPTEGRGIPSGISSDSWVEGSSSSRFSLSAVQGSFFRGRSRPSGRSLGKYRHKTFGFSPEECPDHVLLFGGDPEPFAEIRGCTSAKSVRSCIVTGKVLAISYRQIHPSRGESALSKGSGADSLIWLGMSNLSLRYDMSLCLKTEGISVLIITGRMVISPNLLPPGPSTLMLGVRIGVPTLGLSACLGRRVPEEELAPRFEFFLTNCSSTARSDPGDSIVGMR